MKLIRTLFEGEKRSINLKLNIKTRPMSADLLKVGDVMATQNDLMQVVAVREDARLATMVLLATACGVKRWRVYDLGTRLPVAKRFGKAVFYVSKFYHFVRGDRK